MENNFWREQCKELRHYLSSGDLSFRVWDPVKRIPLYEMFHWVGYMRGVEETERRLDGPDLEVWVEAMKPRVWGFDWAQYERTTLRVRCPSREIVTTTYNAKANHHLESYARLTGRSLLDFDRIVEFGGGTGDLARLALELGYTGEYVIVDLPEILEIQKLNFKDYSGKPPIFSTETPSYRPNTVLVSTWALSETPIELRDIVISTLSPDNWLIVTQRQIFGIDNERFFSNWSGKREEIDWIYWDGGSFYIAE